MQSEPVRRPPLGGAPSRVRRGTGLALLVLAGAAAVGWLEGLVDLLDAGPLVWPRARGLLAYAMATWIAVAALCVLLAMAGGLLVRLVGLRPDKALVVGAAPGLLVGLALVADDRGLLLGLAAVVAVALVSRPLVRRLARRRPLRLALTAWAVLLIAWGLAATTLVRLVAPPERPRHAAAEGGSPAIVLVVADALRADALSCYGGPVPTPRLDELGRAGWRVEDALSTSSWTLPAVASLFTGLAPRDHGVTDHEAVLTADLPHLAEHVAAQGWRTAAVVGNPILAPQRGYLRGFELLRADTHELEASLFWVLRLDRMAVRHGLLSGPNAGRKLLVPAWAGRHGLVPRRSGYLSADEVTDQALQLAEQLEGGPFLLYVHYFDPHDPYRLHPTPLLEHEPPFEAGREEELRRRYLGEVAFLDEQVGRLLDGLQQAGLLDEAVVAFTADHGEEFGEHGGFRHGASLHEELLRLPLLLRFPHGRPVPAPPEGVSLLDVAPTLLAAAGLPPLPGATGRNLLQPAPAEAAPRFAERIQRDAWLVAMRERDRSWVLQLPPELAPAPGELLAWAVRLERPATPLVRWDLGADEPLAVPAGARTVVRYEPGAATDGARALVLGRPPGERAGSPVPTGEASPQPGWLGPGGDGGGDAAGAGGASPAVRSPAVAVPGGVLGARLVLRAEGQAGVLRAFLELRAPGEADWSADWRSAASWSAPRPAGPALLVPRRVPAGTEARLVVQWLEPGGAGRWVVEEASLACDDPRWIVALESHGMEEGPPLQGAGLLDREDARAVLTRMLRHAAQRRPVETAPLEEHERARLEALGYLR